MIEYKDIFEMFDAILGYVSNHPGCKIVSADDPFARRVGFTTSYTKKGLLWRILPFLRTKREKAWVWQISLVNLKGSMLKEGVSKEMQDTLRESFCTPMGRVNLGMALSRGRDPRKLEVTP